MAIQRLWAKDLHKDGAMGVVDTIWLVVIRIQVILVIIWLIVSIITIVFIGDRVKRLPPN